MVPTVPQTKVACTPLLVSLTRSVFSRLHEGALCLRIDHAGFEPVAFTAFPVSASTPIGLAIAHGPICHIWCRAPLPFRRFGPAMHLRSPLL